MYNEIYENIRRNNCLRDEINKLDKELSNICPHNWVRDYDQFSYDSTPKICELWFMIILFNGNTCYIQVILSC